MNYLAHRFGAILVFAFLCSCGGGGGGGGGNSVPPPAPAVTLSLSTTNGVVSVGQSVPVNWTSTGSTCTAQGDWSGTQSANGSAQLTVNQSSVFTLECSNGANSASASLRIEAIGTNSKTTSTVAYSSTALGGPIRLVRLNATGVALVTDLGYVIALNGKMLAQ